MSTLNSTPPDTDIQPAVSDTSPDTPALTPLQARLRCMSNATLYRFACREARSGEWAMLRGLHDAAREYQTPSECDGCGRRRSKGYTLYSLDAMTQCVITGAWSCCLGCAANNAMAQEGGAA